MLWVVAFAALGAASATAEPVRIDLFGEVTSTNLPPGTTDPGDPVTISIFVDSETVDEDGAAGQFLATAPGSFTFVIGDNTPGGGDALAITADAGSGGWTGNMLVTDAGVNLPLTLSLSGSGLNPDQILPDFASFQSGTAFFDGTLTPFEFTVDVDILGVAIVSLGAAPVPAVPLVARLLVGALILGAFSAFAVTGRIR